MSFRFLTLNPAFGILLANLKLAEPWQRHIPGGADVALSQGESAPWRFQALPASLKRTDSFLPHDHNELGFLLDQFSNFCISLPEIDYRVSSFT
jgi:hypothetical protein